ncbi:MAG: PstS family phosphate ABC transporter substrate-binding protein [Candidatus Parcubacteria bacterium]|nr:PstS family phosphate ABC transporter substrate-binding protein [Burkholderiales bacterium]
MASCAVPQFALLIALLIAMLADLSPALAQPVIRIDGSSTVYPINVAVAEDFRKARRKEDARAAQARVAIGVSGTGGGFRLLCRGEADIAGASRPVRSDEAAECAGAGIEYIELPVAFDALTVVVHPHNGFIRQLSIAELKKIWEPAAEGKALLWSDVNPGWPRLPMRLFGPGPESGTFEYFTETVVGRAKASRRDFTASEDDEVLVQGVARDANALGYFGYAYYAENRQRLRAVPIVNGQGKAVAPSAQVVESGDYNPLARPLFIYVNARSLERPELRGFVAHYLARAARLVSEVGYVPLGEKTYVLARERLQQVRTGSGK